MKKTNFLQKNIKVLVATSVGAVLLVGSVYGYYNYQKQGTTDMTVAESNITTGETSTDPTAAPSATTTTPAATESKPTTATTTNRIVVTAPKAGSSIEPGTAVTGTITSLQGGTLYYMIKGETSGVLANNLLQVIPKNTSNTAYSFSISFDRMPKSSESAILEVYLMSGTQRLDYTDVGVRI